MTWLDRSRVIASVALALLFVGLPGAAVAASVVPQDVIVPVRDPSGAIYRLEAALYRPNLPGRLPVVILSHGSPRLVSDRPTMTTRWADPSVVDVFLSRGYVVLVPLRRGYGRSEGPWSEAYGSCANPDFFTAGLRTALDIRAAVDYVAQLPDVDASRIVLVGQSAGAFGSVAAASQNFPGVVAIVNFAGGRASQAAYTVCGEDRLVETYGRYAASVRVPTLWLYAANDTFFWPDLVRRFWVAFANAGAEANFTAHAAVGTEGHRLIFSTSLWQGDLDRFLRQIDDNRAYGAGLAASRVSTVISGTTRSIEVVIPVAEADQGRVGRLFVVATWHGQWFAHDGRTFVAAEPGAFPAYATGPLATTTVPLSSGLDISRFTGATIFVGYGIDAGDALSRRLYHVVEHY